MHMRADEGGADVEAKGPSFGDEAVIDVRLTAVQLASMANVLARDIQYWGREGFLSPGGKRPQGEISYTLSQLPKVKLMALFTKRLEIKAKKASELADALLSRYENSPDAFNATVGMVQLLESRITAFVDLILELDLLPRIGKLLKEAPS